MAEIVDDLKISNVEITSELGINFTSNITRIKHTGNDEFNISSSGEINIRTENKDDGNDCDINLYTGNGQYGNDGDGAEGGDIRLYSGDGGGETGTGGDILIRCGDGITAIHGGRGGYINIYAGDGGGDNEEEEEGAGGGYITMYAGDGVTGNADGGFINIYAGYGYHNGGDIAIHAGDRLAGEGAMDGNGGFIEIYGGQCNGAGGNAGYIDILGGYDNTTGTTGYGGYINIRAGNSDNGEGGNIDIISGYGDINGGDILIECGSKDGNNGNSGASVTIRGGSSNGITGKGGNVVIEGGSGFTGHGDIILGGFGDIIISQGPDQKIAFFGNTPVIRPALTGETTGVVTYNEDQANLRHESTFTGNLGNKAYTISDIVKALKQLGLLDTYIAEPGVAQPAATYVPQPRAERPVKVRKDKSKKEKDN